MTLFISLGIYSQAIVATSARCAFQRTLYMSLGIDSEAVLTIALEVLQDVNKLLQCCVRLKP